MTTQHHDKLSTKILKELTTEGFIDYDLLAKKNNFKLYPKILNDLLKQAEKSFENILTLKKNDINFTNVIEAYLHHDRLLTILYTFLNSLNNTNNSAYSREIIELFRPKVVEHYNKTSLHKGYYKLLKKVLTQKLTSDQKRSIDLLIKNMEMSGVALPEKQRKIVENINKEMSKLSQKFVNNILDSKKEFYFEVKDEDILKEMPEAELQMAMAEAKDRKSKAKYVFTLSPPSLQAVLKYCSDRSVRELFYKKAFTVASKGKLDNRPLIVKILKLRKQKADILGFKDYTHYVLQTRMAENGHQIETLLDKIFAKAVNKCKKEIKELSRFAGLEKLEEWDVSYYSEKYRQKNFKIDARKLKEFFPLNQVTKGLFEIMRRLFGLTFKPLHVKSYYPDLQVFEVWKDNEFLAYYIADFYARPSKKAGAWCNDLRPGYVENGKYHVPIIINVMNFPQPHEDKPSLLSHRDVETLFHEFGHALHLLFSSQNYANLNGFNTEWDFVEFPSQLLENWCWEMDSLKLFAKHYVTKKVIPTAMVEKLNATKTFMSGYMVLRQLEFAFLDLHLHNEKAINSVKELDAVCEKVVHKVNILKKFKGYKFYTGFDHVFAGGYAAGYYSYIWAEILEADAFYSKMKKGILNSNIGQEYLTKIVMPGAKKKGSELFKDLMGRNPRVDAFIKKHGLD